MNVFENQAEVKLRCCPVCGTTDLRVFVLRPVCQNDEGYWEFPTMHEEDIYDITIEVNNVNNEVYCGNQLCGHLDHADPSIHIPHTVSRVDLFAWWLQHHKAIDECEFNSLSPELQQEYIDFEQEVNNTPFRGVLGDCPVIK